MKNLKVKLGFGKKEAAKTGKGVVVGGFGALAYSLISGVGYMPDAFTAPDVMPYVVAGLSAAINFVRQFIVDND
jgi:hypothetical protein|tara:strand:+ start:77 stop:298 length:222 start_codon:yes stop_codon:yes gene_type:complete